MPNQHLLDTTYMKMARHGDAAKFDEERPRGSAGPVHRRRPHDGLSLRRRRLCGAGTRHPQARREERLRRGAGRQEGPRVRPAREASAGSRRRGGEEVVYVCVTCEFVLSFVLCAPRRRP